MCNHGASVYYIIASNAHVLEPRDAEQNQTLRAKLPREMATIQNHHVHAKG